MLVTGTLLLNDVPASAGVRVGAWVGDDGPFAEDTTDSVGAFGFSVPADNASTPQRDGARAGESISFRALGVESAARATFASGGVRNVTVHLLLPDLAFVGVESPSGEIAEGESFVVRGQLANRGRAIAPAVRVTLSEGGRELATAAVGELAAGASRAFEISGSSAGLEGNRTVVLTASSSMADADAASDAATARVRVVADEAPVVDRVSLVPNAPAAGETVLVSVDASDPDGISHVLFYWQTDTVRSANATHGPPWQTVLGGFPPGATVRYWATVVDAGPAAKATTTPPATFVVQGGATATTTPAADTTPAPTPTPTPTPPPTERAVPGGWIALAIVAIALASRAHRG